MKLFIIGFMFTRKGFVIIYKKYIIFFNTIKTNCQVVMDLDKILVITLKLHPGGLIINNTKLPGLY